MSPRKSPYRHKVRNHVRQKRPVKQYERGKGDQIIISRKSRVVGGSLNPTGGSYDITIIYAASSEQLDVDAKNYLGALDGGLADREEIEAPRMIRIRRGS